MALQINYNLKVKYSLGRFNQKSMYTNILTNEQISQLDEFIEKNFLIENTYCKINELNGNKDNVEIKLNIYMDRTKQILIISQVYTFIPNLSSNKNFIQQGYEYLKTLDEFKDAIDLLDEGQTA